MELEREIAELAAEKGLSVEKSAPVARFSSLSEITLPRSLLEDLFKAEVGEIVMGPTADGYAVARLKEIQSATATSNVEDLKQLQETLSTAIANDVIQEYTQALRDEYSVSVNKGALDAYFSNQGFGGRR